jgi:Arc/MetJ-type ribon-helix-helix transcriptional regulator
MGCTEMGRFKMISAKIPEEVYKELVLRVPEGERSEFLREAIIEKLQRIPRPDRILELERKIGRLEAEILDIKKHLAELEVLTFEEGKVNPHVFCIDDMDHKIVDYLLTHEGATTPELAEFLKTNRWHVLNRLRKIQKRSRRQLGKSIVEYYAGERMGKRRAWWIREELVEM